MTWTLNSDRPIYAQLMEKIRTDIVSGWYEPGERLASVRELAVEAAVNPNTMQKALSELERSGLIYSQRTSGRFITEDKDMIQNIRKSMAEEEIRAFFEKMRRLGFSGEETMELLKKALKEGEQ